MCKNINHIRESFCIEASDNNPNLKNIDTTGCYIKGTKTMYVTPVFTNKEIIEDRLNALKTYPKYSRDFWDYHKANANR